MQWVELEHWDWSSCGLTFSLVITIWAAYEMLRQAVHLWSQPEMKGESLSYNANAYFFITNIVVGLYGWHFHKLALFINGGFMSLMYLPVMVGLFKLKPLKRLETLVLSPTLLIALIISVTHRSLLKEMFFILSLGGLLFQLAIPWEIFRNKERGVVRVQVFVPFIFSTMVWWGYAIVTHDPVLIWTSPMYLAVLTVTIAVWLRYPNRSQGGVE